MPFITFMYKIAGDDTRYYGKYYTLYMSDDHEGLDMEVRYKLERALSRRRGEKIRDGEVTIGVLSYSDSNFVGVYSSHDEIAAFDFYYLEEKNIYDTYLGGELVKMT